jgi:SpoVK/Ycf46/Vps4 family AAA+-type ATPase
VTARSTTTVHELKTLVLSFHPVIAIDTVEEERVERLLEAVALELGAPLYVWTLTRGLVQKPATQANRSTASPLDVLGHLATLTVEALFLLKDFARHLADPAVCREFREVAQRYAHTRAALVVTGAGHQFPPDAEAHVVHFELALPDEAELAEVVTGVVRSLEKERGVPVAAASPPELRAIARALCGTTANQARQLVARAILEDGRLTADDARALLDHKARLLRREGLLEYLPPEQNAFELGGFANLKRWLERARVGFTPEARALGLDPPGGVLLVGVQGCGKSLAAKCIARDWRLPLLKLDAGRLYDKYVGESERNLRRAIATAEGMAPAVLWIDELEKAFASATSGEHDGGTSQRLFATLLTWLQEKKQGVFVVATANDVFRLPPELVRKGRFDEIFFVDLPDADERAAILAIHLRRRSQDPAALDLARLVAASDGFSGAELEQAVVSGLYAALHAKRPLATETLLAELAATVPLSVSRRESVEQLRALARERFVPVR